jgi:RimJ/RimL family protein N-acetyltransferase
MAAFAERATGHGIPRSDHGNIVQQKFVHIARIPAGPIVLERYNAQHAWAVWAAIQDSRARLQPWVPEIASLSDIEQVQTGIAQLANAWHNGRKAVYAVLARWDGRFLGEVGLYAIDWSQRSATLGVWLCTAAEGNGYASAAITALAHAADRNLGLEALDARVHPLNERSQRLMQRTGFELTGTSPAMRSFEGDTATVLLYRRLLSKRSRYF